jgi:hypothetical protein
MRAPDSTMIPLLSRFDAFLVSPADVLSSDVAIRTALGAPPAPEARGWLGSAVHRVSEVALQGSACLVGLSAHDATARWDAAASAVLAELAHLRRDHGDGALTVTAALARELTEGAVRRPVSLAR